MKPLVPLPSLLDRSPGRVNVLLFSQPQCEFCFEVRERYLKPLAAARRPRINVAEASIVEVTPIRDWSGKTVTQQSFARSSDARFAPTVMFVDGAGRSLAEPIVGLSRDFFGAYLEQRLAAALHALPRTVAD
ncbi:MAG: hypothetical protein M3Z16_07765 [Pseudomonadota bacterium]|nr:hypothetical protein [Pseudomonadota bacterium]